MSDTVILAIITSTTTILSVVITGFINSRATRKHVCDLNNKVDEYHKEVNGKMGVLLETTKALGIKEGKEEEKKNPE